MSALAAATAAAPKSRGCWLAGNVGPLPAVRCWASAGLGACLAGVPCLEVATSTRGVSCLPAAFDCGACAPANVGFTSLGDSNLQDQHQMISFMHVFGHIA